MICICGPEWRNPNCDVHGNAQQECVAEPSGNSGRLLLLRITERYLDGRSSRVLTGNNAGGYESVAHLRLLARSRGWQKVFDIPSGVQHRTRGVLSDSTWGEMLCDVQLIDPAAPRCTWILATTGRCTNPATNGDVCGPCEDARDKRRD